MKTKRYNIVSSIPGGWYGNDASKDNPAGNVVVDVQQIEVAIIWLRRYAVIEKSEMSYHRDPGGVLLSYHLKAAKKGVEK